MSLAIRNTDIIDSMGGRKLVLAESGEVNYGDAESVKTVETILEREYESGGYLVLSDFGFAAPSRITGSNGTFNYWNSGLWLGRDDFFNDEYLLDNYFVDDTKKKFPVDISYAYSNPFNFKEKLYMYINKGLAYCLNEDTDDWEVSELPWPSSLHSTGGANPWYFVEKDDKLYCMEYYSNTLYIHIYNPDTDSWTSTDRLMTLYNGGFANLVLYNDQLHFFINTYTGSSSPSYSSNGHYVWDEENGLTRVDSGNPSYLIVSSFSVVFRNRIFIFANNASNIISWDTDDGYILRQSNPSIGWLTQDSSNHRFLSVCENEDTPKIYIWNANHYPTYLTNTVNTISRHYGTYYYDSANNTYKYTSASDSINNAPNGNVFYINYKYKNKLYKIANYIYRYYASSKYSPTVGCYQTNKERHSAENYYGFSYLDTDDASGANPYGTPRSEMTYRMTLGSFLNILIDDKPLFSDPLVELIGTFPGYGSIYTSYRNTNTVNDLNSPASVLAAISGDYVLNIRAAALTNSWALYRGICDLLKFNDGGVIGTPSNEIISGSYATASKYRYFDKVLNYVDDRIYELFIKDKLNESVKSIGTSGSTAIYNTEYRYRTNTLQLNIPFDKKIELHSIQFKYVQARHYPSFRYKIYKYED